jgi:putative transposase
MTREPYVLPGLPGKKTLADNLDQGALFEADDGTTYSYRGLLPGGHWAMYSLDEELRPLMMPDPVTGVPSYPTHDQIIEAMANDRLHYVSSPLDTPARVRARGLERTKAEVLAADSYAEVRMSVCRAFDKERPARDNASLEKWSDQRFDWAAIKQEHGKDKPPASTLRAWINKRGRPGNRCWADMEDRRGQGPRRKRVTGHRLAIAGFHAVSHWTSRRHPSVSKLYKDVVADTNAYNLGKALIMHNGVRMWDVPPAGEKIAPVDPEFFRQLVKRLESRTAYRHRYSAQAAQQRWEGGGEAAEPVRFLDIVQQDETEAPAFFFVDSINRVPLGKATWVIAVCVYTRCVLAWDLSFDAPSKVSWMRNILNASKMKDLPKEWKEAFPALATIGGRMSSIIYDNPSHLIGQTVEDAHGDLLQDVIFAGEGQPTHKALVERTHETLRSLFTAKLPGSKMSIALASEFNIDAATETLLTLQEARLAMTNAICTYHTTPLKGLNWRTPLDMWEEQWNRWGPQLAKDQEQFARAIGEVTFDRALNNGGIVHEHLEYSHREITPMLMEAYAGHSHHRRKAKKPTFDVKVKYDPTDMSRIFVFDPQAAKYRELPAKKRRYTEGLTLAMHRLVLRNHRAKSLMADPDAENRLLDLRRMAEIELKKICPKMEANEKRARAAIMQQPIIRDMMGGDIHLIEVVPSPTGMEVQHDTGFNRADALEKPVRSKRGTKHNDAHAQPDDTDADDVSILLSAGPQDAEWQEVASDLPRERADTDVAPIDDEDDDIIGTFDDY